MSVITDYIEYFNYEDDELDILIWSLTFGPNLVNIT